MQCRVQGARCKVQSAKCIRHKCAQFSDIGLPLHTPINNKAIDLCKSAMLVVSPVFVEVIAVLIIMF